MSHRFALICLGCALACWLSDPNLSRSQELKKVRSDYFSGGVQYSPHDPWVRSKVFQAHTGHSGWFYNCDEEECKRHSPYIYWTSNCQPLWPEHRGLWHGLKRDLDNVRRRLHNGACGCESCPACESCEDGKCSRGNCRQGSCQQESCQNGICPNGSCQKDQLETGVQQSAKHPESSGWLRSADRRQNLNR